MNVWISKNGLQKDRSSLKNLFELFEEVMGNRQCNNK